MIVKGDPGIRAGLNVDQVQNRYMYEHSYLVKENKALTQF